jgi:hypothetical protein
MYINVTRNVDISTNRGGGAARKPFPGCPYINPVPTSILER